MIRALVVGTLRSDPEQRTGKNGKPYAFARLSVPMDNEGRVWCSVIAFEPDAVTRLVQLREGAQVAAAGILKVKTFTRSDGVVSPSLDMMADEIASTTPRPKKPTPERPGAANPSCCQAAGGVDWLGA
jgi:single-stranded DNA-binding protein